MNHPSTPHNDLMNDVTVDMNITTLTLRTMSISGLRTHGCSPANTDVALITVIVRYIIVTHNYGGDGRTDHSITPFLQTFSLSLGVDMRSRDGLLRPSLRVKPPRRDL